MTEPYVELHCHSYFSLLDAASSPESLVARAKELGMSALALTDHDSLAGAVRFWKAAKQVELHAVIGAEVTLEGGNHLTLLAENQHGYANLCRLMTAAHLRETPSDPSLAPNPSPWTGKGAPALSWESLNEHRNGLIALSGCRRSPVTAPLVERQPDQAKAMATRLCEILGQENFFIELQHHRLPDDDRIVRESLTLAHTMNLGCVATNDVHYATHPESRLRDALIAVRHIQTLAEVRRAGLLPLNSSYVLASSAEMARRFREVPQAIRNTVEIGQRCQVSLDFSNERLPAFPVPDGKSEFEYLYELCHQGIPRRYPDLQPEVLKQLAHELSIIQAAGLAGYFLSVWDIMRFAREHGVRAQGRGSAANSLVAYLLNITNVDPLKHNLLFERFLSSDRFTIPDIDIDFAADTREQVIQYVYERYGVSHAAMVCNVVTYQARSAVRDLGKALDFPLDAIDRISKSLDTNSCEQAARAILERVEEDVPNHPLRLLADLLSMIQDVPRHLSIHNGGMLITSQPLNEVVPLERATMPGRVVAEWNKDSVEDAGLIKIDLLGLRTLGLLSEALSYLDDAKRPDLDALPLDDPRIYDMLQRGDTIGAFQVESRAQQQMLPRLKPMCFEDITIEVAIVRPGPIQGGAVHPYLRRRNGDEPVTYVHPCLEPVLRETLGVLLFQEQAIRVAMVAANFAPGEADMLRRALSRNDAHLIEGPLHERFIQGAEAKGIDRETANAIFQQLAGFAGYGFCKSHAASFALIAYQTMHLKCYYPAPFYCALLNQQPMGFYSPEVVINDAKRHGVEIFPPEVNRSAWKYTLDKTNGEKLALRMGYRTISGFGEQVWERVRAAHEESLFSDLRDFCIRTRLPQSTISDLIRAGMFDAFGGRRDLLWELGGIDYRPEELPLEILSAEVELPELEDVQATVWEYELLGLSPNTQLIRHYREVLQRMGVLSTVEVKGQESGRVVRVGGMAVVKQRPSTAKGILFVSLEDEFGLLDLIVKPKVYERYRDLIKHQTFLLVEGTVQKASGAVSVLVTRALEWSR